MPHSVAKLVGKKNNYRWFYRRKLRTKKNSRLKYTDGFIPSVSVNYRQNISVGQGDGDCEICTKLL
jgi:hypothetical protein